MDRAEQLAALIAALSWYAAPVRYHFPASVMIDGGDRARLALVAWERQLGAGLPPDPSGEAKAQPEPTSQQASEGKKESLPRATPGGHATHPESRARKRSGPHTDSPSKEVKRQDILNQRHETATALCADSTPRTNPTIPSFTNFSGVEFGSLRPVE